MRRLLKLLPVVLLISAFSAKADIALSNSELLALAQLDAQTMSLIDWKIGDTMNYDMSLGGFIPGKMVKTVSSEEGDAIWIVQNIDLTIQKQKVEMLMNRSDGKILKMRVDGKEQTIPNDKIEIVSQEASEITVKAGHFEAIHVVIKSEQIKRAEVWINPSDTAMDGTLKQVISAQMEITAELTSFTRN